MRLEAEALREQAARREAEAQREEAVRCAAEAQRELAALREAAEHQGAAAHEEAEAQREHSACPEVEAHSEPVRSSPTPRELALRGATDRAVPLVADAQSIVPSTRGRTASVDAPAAPSEEKRRDRRVDSQISATLWGESKKQALACTIRDKSSSGAKLEFAPDRYGDGITELVVGDKLTLTFNAGQERTSVGCVVAWVAGSRCGVRFSGQFHTQINNPRKTAKSMVAPEKTLAAKPTKPKFPDGAWRRPFFRAD